MAKIKRASDKLPWVAEVKGNHKRKADPSFYNKKVWRKLAKTMKQEQPFCEVCQSNGITVACDVTDHLIRIESGGAKLDPMNLMNMCHNCHNQKSGKETHSSILIPWELNDDGRRIPKDRTDIFNIFPKSF